MLDAHNNQYNRHLSDPIETAKVTELRDVVGNLRYRIVMTSQDILDYSLPKYDKNHFNKSFQIEVINYFFGPEPLVLIHNPDIGEDPIYDYNEAINIFNGYVKQYNDLLKAESRDIQKIDIYREEIGYKNVEVDCCKRCKYCKRIKDPREHTIQRTEKFVCSNPKIIKNSPFDYSKPECHDKYHPNNRHNEHHNRPDIGMHLNLWPTIELDGICKLFEKNIKPIKDVAGLDLIETVYKKFDREFDSFKEKLSSDVNIDIDQKLEDQKQSTTEEINQTIEESLAGEIILDGNVES